MWGELTHRWKEESSYYYYTSWGQPGKGYVWAGSKGHPKVPQSVLREVKPDPLKSQHILRYPFPHFSKELEDWVYFQLPNQHGTFQCSYSTLLCLQDNEDNSEGTSRKMYRSSTPLPLRLE